MKKALLLLVFAVAFVGLVKADEIKKIAGTDKVSYRKSLVTQDIAGAPTEIWVGKTVLFSQGNVDSKRKQINRQVIQWSDKITALQADLVTLDLIEAELVK